jgi:hypothetical protein
VATDWNGYRETVRDGVDGFLVPTWSPAGGYGDWLAAAAETGAMGYDRRNWETVMATALDLGVLAERLAALVGDPQLRRRMGAAGQARVRAEFDWSHIYPQYQALWGELDDRRRAAGAGAAPASAPAFPDPYLAFAHYPTHAISAGTRLTLAPGAAAERFRRLAAHGLWPIVGEREAYGLRLLGLLEQGPATVEALALATRTRPEFTVSMAGTLAKMGLVRLADP